MPNFKHNDTTFSHSAFPYVVFGGIALIIFLFAKDIGIFWDNVLFVSRMGNHIFQEGLTHLHIDAAFDPGHPPFIAWWQALGWNVLGHNLWVSHLIMIPFQIGLMSQILRMARFFLKKPLHHWLAFAWIMLDPTLLAQFVLVSPETIQLFFLFLAVNGILYRRKIHLAIGLSLLGIVSYRGMMLCAGIFLFDICRYLFVKKKRFQSEEKSFNWWPYMLGAIPAISFILWHKMTTGWVYSHTDSPWISTSGMVDLKGFFRNILILGRNALDFGRIGVFALSIFFIIRNPKMAKHRDVRTLFLLALLSTIVITVVSLMLTNPMAHRYFLASYIAIHLLTVFMLFHSFEKMKTWILPFVFIILGTGNLWIYPERLAQGWDASLASMPYFALRDDAINYLNESNIPIEDVATFFPNIAPLDYVDLKGDMRSFGTFDGHNKYVLYATVYNLTDAEYDALAKDYKLLKRFTKNRIEIDILIRIQ